MHDTAHVNRECSFYEQPRAGCQVRMTIRQNLGEATRILSVYGYELTECANRAAGQEQVFVPFILIRKLTALHHACNT